MKRFAVLALSCALAAPLAAQNAFTVNGEAVSQQQFDNFVNLLVKEGATDTPELRAQVKDEMVIRLIAVQEAQANGIDKQPEVAQELELARQGILVRALLNDYIKNNPVSEKELKTQYEELKQAESGQKEYKARHILVESEEEAKKLLADIKSKATSFEDAAKAHSTDTGSGANGGDLGWAPNDIYVAEFSEALQGMKKGELSTAPVQSEFGWHIIEVNDIREAQFPEFEEVKPQLEEMMRKQQLSEYQQSLMSKAKVE